jgi:hypothetical protein
MEDKMTRRGFTGWVGKAALATLFAGAMGGSAQSLYRRRGGSLGQFVGSAKGTDLNGAIRNAVDQARKQSRGNQDFSWRLVETRGTTDHHGRSELTAVLEVFDDTGYSDRDRFDRRDR